MLSEPSLAKIKLSEDVIDFEIYLHLHPEKLLQVTTFDFASCSIGIIIGGPSYSNVAILLELGDQVTSNR